MGLLNSLFGKDKVEYDGMDVFQVEHESDSIIELSTYGGADKDDVLKVAQMFCDDEGKKVALHFNNEIIGLSPNK